MLVYYVAARLVAEFLLRSENRENGDIHISTIGIYGEMFENMLKYSDIAFQNKITLVPWGKGETPNKVTLIGKAPSELLDDFIKKYDSQTAFFFIGDTQNIKPETEKVVFGIYQKYLQVNGKEEKQTITTFNAATIKDFSFVKEMKYSKINLQVQEEKDEN
jgi:hypothetical protein